MFYIHIILSHQHCITRHLYLKIDSLNKIVNCFSVDIKMESELKKCWMLILKKQDGVQYEDNLKLPTRQVMKRIKKEGNRYLGILEEGK